MTRIGKWYCYPQPSGRIRLAVADLHQAFVKPNVLVTIFINQESITGRKVQVLHYLGQVVVHVLDMQRLKLVCIGPVTAPNVPSICITFAWGDEARLSAAYLTSLWQIQEWNQVVAGRDLRRDAHKGIYRKISSDPRHPRKSAAKNVATNRVCTRTSTGRRSTHPTQRYTSASTPRACPR